jgi:hypothetical protein
MKRNFPDARVFALDGIRSASTTIGPRDAFTRRAVGFMIASSGAPTRLMSAAMVVVAGSRGLLLCVMRRLRGWADRIRTSRRRFVEQPSTAGERTHNVSGPSRQFGHGVRSRAGPFLSLGASETAVRGERYIDCRLRVPLAYSSSPTAPYICAKPATVS